MKPLLAPIAALIALGTASAALAERSAAERACAQLVKQNNGGGHVEIASSDYSEAGTIVMVKDHKQDGGLWRCLASNDGVVEDLSFQEN
jgi:hypothetical protein